MMSKKDFGACMAYLEAGIGVAMPADQAKVYYDLLADLPVETLQVACKRVLLQHEWKTFPSVAELRREAAKALPGHCEITPSQAWDIARRCVGNIDLQVDGQRQREMAKIPAVVQKAILQHGFHILYYLTKARVAGERVLFMKTFEEVVRKEQANLLLPEAVRNNQAITGESNPRLSHITKNIGVEK